MESLIGRMTRGLLTQQLHASVQEPIMDADVTIIIVRSQTPRCDCPTCQLNIDDEMHTIVP